MKRLIVVMVLVLAAALGVWFGGLFVSEAWFGGTPSPTITSFEVPEGASAADVAAKLELEGLVASALRYRLYARVDTAASRPKVGYR